MNTYLVVINLSHSCTTPESGISAGNKSNVDIKFLSCMHWISLSVLRRSIRSIFPSFLLIKKVIESIVNR